MADIWIYVAGGIILSVIAFVIAYSMMVGLVDSSQRQTATTQFSNFYNNVVASVCIQEINNSMNRTISFPSLVRIVYATDETSKPLVKVVDLIKNAEMSSGKNLCMQFKDEQNLRCFPQPPDKMYCTIKMPYLGVLPETEDIFMKVKKILGQPEIRDFNLFVKKTEGDVVEISVS
jgi:hypothetical protein